MADETNIEALREERNRLKSECLRLCFTPAGATPEGEKRCAEISRLLIANTQAQHRLGYESFHLATRTGRISCSEPNLANSPKPLEELDGK